MRRLRLMLMVSALVVAGGLAGPSAARALDASRLGVVVNTADPASVEIGDYYVRRRGVPRANVVFVPLPA